MSRGSIVVLLCVAGGILVGGIATVAVGFNSGDLKLSSLVPAGATNTAQFRTSFIDSSKRSCIRTATARISTVPAEKIEAYCGCFAERSVDVFTEDDVKYMVDHLGSVPATLMPKLQPIVAECQKEAHVTAR
jgi:hypothetical protein